MWKTFLIVLSCLGAEWVQSQHFLPPSEQYQPDRLKKVVITEAVIGTAVSVGLYYLWYKKFPRSRFHLLKPGNATIWNAPFAVCHK